VLSQEEQLSETVSNPLRWNDAYYEMLEFYYWEPQHLGRAKKTNGFVKTVDAITARLRTIEVPLNHLLEFFFALAPKDFTSRFLGCESLHPDIHLVSSGHLLHAPLGALIQPDLFFDSAGLRACVEVKVGSRSTPEQMLKYSVLMERHAPQTAAVPRRLVLLGPKTFQDFWERRAFSSVDDLKEALLRAATISSQLVWKSLACKSVT
jgi:hypothetical protein